jgi:aryl carrier-like protein
MESNGECVCWQPHLRGSDDVGGGGGGLDEGRGVDALLAILWAEKIREKGRKISMMEHVTKGVNIGFRVLAKSKTTRKIPCSRPQATTYT